MWRLLVFGCLFFSSPGNAVDPEASMTVPEIIKRWNYPVETHQVTTEDGYILTLHRIPRGKGPQQNPQKVVFLQHGLLASSSTWITNLPHLSLDAGFDVWLGNSRGNLYSRNHTTMTPSSRHWDHMAKYDLTASIGHILAETIQPYVYYVGHSQGTLIMFSKLASDPSFNEKIRQFHALAPIVSGYNVKGLIMMLSYLPIDIIAEMFGLGELLLTHDNWLTYLSKLPCKNPTTSNLCSNFLFALSGYNSRQLNASRIPVYLSDYPAGTSTQNLLHWTQVVRTGQHRMYDYWNPYTNMKYYGKPLPPFYNVSKIKTPMWLYWSPEDWLSTERDIKEYLIPRLNEDYLRGSYKLENFNHLDFVWGDLAAKKIYKFIIQTMLDDEQ